MKINVGKAKPVVQAKPGDIAYFDNDYWLIGLGEDETDFDERYHFTSLTQANSMNQNMRDAWIRTQDLTGYLEIKKAIIFDGSKSKLDLVIKEPKDDHEQAS